MQEASEIKESGHSDIPFQKSNNAQFKNLRLSQIKEAPPKLIYFEEYEPLNQSSRNFEGYGTNGGLITGGRTISCTSNSNRFSLSKTINFNMAMFYQPELAEETPVSHKMET
mmetsp:Transcript_40444/g.38929  ORF Transcript_40444/g.38929 Transcript_40444/m.38929 type:complete len:112 (+) Transcript_40444:498-833(+)